MEFKVTIVVDGPTAAWGLGNNPPDADAVLISLITHLEGESFLVNSDRCFSCVIDEVKRA